MEVLALLEKKIVSLLDLIKQLKAENAQLTKENNEFLQKIKTLEDNVICGNEELNNEKELTKMVVNDLLKNIDSLVNNENVQL